MECDPRNNHHPIPFPLSQLLLTKSQNNCRPPLVIQIRPIQVRPLQVRPIHVRPPLSPVRRARWSILTPSSLRQCNPPSTAPKQAHWRNLKTVFELTGIVPPTDNASPTH